jgi:formyltetrahydrofolate deformylase
MSVVLLLSCPDQPGIVAATAGFIAELDGNIIHAEQHVDTPGRVEGSAGAAMFFQRIEFDLPSGSPTLQVFRRQFRSVADRFSMEVDLHDTDVPMPVAVLASSQPHCLYDLLTRWRSGELPMDVRVVISNHDDHRSFCEHLGARFVHLTIGPHGKHEQEAAMLEVLSAHDVDLVVLARYMQILGPDVVDAYPNRIINIHHSFLPAFVGASPYRQAYDRGVKLIGATAHYATTELDEGPIIEQDTAHVSHRDDVKRLTARGRDLETIVLARAVRAHLERRVLVHGRKTVVFS